MNGQGLDGVEVGRLARGVCKAIATAPSGCVAIRGVHHSPGKHVRARHERRPRVASDHEDFGPARAVAQNEHGGGGSWFAGFTGFTGFTGLSGHRATLARDYAPGIQNDRPVIS